MIELTKMNGERIVVNVARIETVEGRPDTSVVLQSGTRFVVRETPAEVVALARAYHREIAALALADLRGNVEAAETPSPPKPENPGQTGEHRRGVGQDG